MKRRTFVKGALAATGLAALTGLYTWQIEPFWLEFVQRKLPIKNLPEDLEGKILMQISDVHVGNAFNPQYISDSFEEARAFDPDFVVYTGDYISYENEEQFTQLEKVLQKPVLGKLGTVGILGNHDYGHNWSQPEVASVVTSQLESCGITVLRNDQKSIAGLNFIGIDDFWGTNHNPDLVMPHVDHNQANIVLCHNPDVADQPVWHGYEGWILAGHTHGGQCKPPFLPPPMLPVKNKRYTSGEIDLEDGRKLYINRALGHLIQVRFNVRPEITVFELTSA